MKSFFFLVLLLLLATEASFAQESILMGKIVDDNNMPIAGAGIQLSKSGHGFITKTSSDNDGLFYTQLLPVGNYRMAVLVKDKYLKTKVYLPDESKKNSYYYLRIKGDKVHVTMDEQNPFSQASRAKLDSEDPRRLSIYDGKSAVYILRKDTTTYKAINIYSTPVQMPRMKDVK